MSALFAGFQHGTISGPTFRYIGRVAEMLKAQFSMLKPGMGIEQRRRGIEEAGGDAAFIVKALGDIARAKGMAQVARDAGLSRESLYKALSGKRSPPALTRSSK